MRHSQKGNSTGNVHERNLPDALESYTFKLKATHMWDNELTHLWCIFYNMLKRSTEQNRVFQIYIMLAT